MRLISTLIFIGYSFLCHAQSIDWSISNDSAKYYYEEGWNYVMNEGNYSLSEVTYRKMHQYDPQFMIGAALLGRISTDLEEQKTLLSTIKTNEKELSQDESTVLEVYTALHELMIVRQESPGRSAELVKKALGTAMEEFGMLVRKYPDEQYLKSEYIEVIHYWHGPSTALDSLEYYDPDGIIVFLKGYKALLLAEKGERSQAIRQSDLLFTSFDDLTIPKPWAVKSQVYFELKDFDLAFWFAKKGLALDPKNVDLLRIVDSIENKKG